MAEHWLRLWHGTVTDPKFRMVARDASRNVTQRHAASQAEIPCHAVLSVWLYLLETASQNDDRGSVDGLDVEVMAFTLDMPTDHAEAIVSAMESRGLIEDNRLNGWEKRQPKREDTTAAERQRARRERNAESRVVTQCHAASRTVTTEEKRGEEKREEKKDQEHVPTPAEPAPAQPKANGKAKSVTLKNWLSTFEPDQSAIEQDDPIFEWAESVGLSYELVELAWIAFCDRYTGNGKRYTDWRAVFRNAVKGNWLKLWYIRDGQYLLTTVGEQARRAAA